MNLLGYYTDGTLIASGSFGDVYVVPFEGSIAAVVRRNGQTAYEFLARERLAKLVEQGTLVYSVDFAPLDFDNLASETYLNTTWGKQGGWHIGNNAADGIYTQYTKSFSGYRITNDDTRNDETQDAILGLTLAVVNQRKTEPKYTGLRKLWNEATGW